MNITVKVIPHAEQKYDTCGDYWWTGRGDTGDLEVRVSRLSDWRYELLIAVHEIVEACLCRWFRVPEERIRAFDENYERERLEGHHGPSDEPGNDPNAPYRVEHFFATTVERLLAGAMLVDWSEYDREVPR